MRILYFILTVLFTQGTFAQSAAPPPTHHKVEEFELENKVDQLLLCMQKRLAIMHEVARTKWNQNIPIEDKVREQQILIELVKLGSGYGLDKVWVSQFFQAQMDAAKEMQKNDFALWQELGLGKFEKVFSLKDELRFYIDQLNKEILELLSKLQTKDLQNLVLNHPISIRSSDHIENKVWLMAISAL